MGATFLKLHCRARSVRRVARNFSAFSANSAVKSDVYLAFAPELKCVLVRISVLNGEGVRQKVKKHYNTRGW